MLRQKNTNICSCSEANRTLYGTYYSPELLKAVEVGYTMIRIYEVCHWSESSQYDATSKSGGLFAGYMNLFFKLKQEASGWPCDIDHDQYIQDALD